MTIVSTNCFYEIFCIYLAISIINFISLPGFLKTVVYTLLCLFTPWTKSSHRYFAKLYNMKYYTMYLRCHWYTQFHVIFRKSGYLIFKLWMKFASIARWNNLVKRLKCIYELILHDDGGESASKGSIIFTNFLLSLPAKLPPWQSSFLTLHNLSQFLLSGHNNSRAAYILLTGPIRSCSSGGGSRKITVVSLSMLSQIIEGG